MRLTEKPDAELAESIRQLSTAILENRASMNKTVGLVDENGDLMGPFACLPFSPIIGNAVQDVGAKMRSETVLPSEAVESAILTVATRSRADFEWFAHERIASSTEVIPLDDISRIGRGELPNSEPARTASQIASTLLDGELLCEADYAKALHRFGERGLVELVILVGYYHLLALLNVTFETPIASTAKLPWNV